MWRHVVLVVFSLAVCALASRERIESQGCVIRDVPAGTSGALSYYFPPRDLSPGLVNCSGQDTPRCNQTVNSAFLSGRSWYITQDKAYYGQGYNPWLFETFNIQCPEGHFLYLSMLKLRMVCTIDSTDTVRVNTSRGYTAEMCTPADLASSYLSNQGRGIFLENGRAEVDFCSDGDLEDEGFVLRGTCINPVLYYNQLGCVSYQFWSVWDPGFVNRIQEIFDIIPTTLVPHKRSAEENAMMFENMREKMKDLKAAEREVMALKRRLKKEEDKKLARDKRGVRYYFTFPEGTTITYINSNLLFQFPNGTSDMFLVYCLTAFNDLYGTRVYTRNATRQIGDTTGATTITFTGPGWVDIAPNSDRTSINGILHWTVPDEESFLEQDIVQQQIAERIYRYISNQWVDPYVVVDDIQVENLRPPPFPLMGPESDLFPRGVRTRNQVGVRFPNVEPGSKCRKAIRLDVAPLHSSRIDPDILAFCSFFQFACDPVLATVCREIMLLDPFDVDPLSRSRMRMMGGGD